MEYSYFQLGNYGDKFWDNAAIKEISDNLNVSLDDLALISFFTWNGLEHENLFMSLHEHFHRKYNTGGLFIAAILAEYWNTDKHSAKCKAMFLSL